MTQLSFDPIGRWFKARSHHGIDDRMTFGIIGVDGQRRITRTLSHAESDGIGAMQSLLSGWSTGFIAPPNSREKNAPSVRELLQKKSWLRERQQVMPEWRFGSEPSFAGQEAVQFLMLTVAQTAALEDEAKRRGVSLLSLLLWAQHRMVMEQLCCNTDGGTWFVPVNLRGPLKLPLQTMNHSAGVYLDVSAQVTPQEIHDALRSALKRKQHWWNFYQALWTARLGQRFLNWLYPRIAKPGAYLGSFSMLGDWQVQWPQANQSQNAALYCCGPGSPAYPVANGVILTNGRLSLSLRLDRYLGHDANTTQLLLQTWRDHLLSLLNDDGVAEENRQCRHA